MPSQKQTTTRSVATKGAMGSADSQTLSALFAGSPVFSDKMEPDAIVKGYEDLVLNGTVLKGYGFPEVDLDYSAAPSYGDVPTGGGGDPASPWVPNPVSPGEGSVNPADVGDPPAGFGTRPSGGTVGSKPATGPADVSPKDASATMATSTIGGLKLGSSRFTTG